jgi:hypothetical protein
MSWRRFSVLVRCLSPNSATVAKLSSGQYIGQRRQQAKAVAGKDAAERAFQSLFGPERAPQPRQEDG